MKDFPEDISLLIASRTMACFPVSWSFIPSSPNLSPNYSPGKGGVVIVMVSVAESV